jgi:hypothetical protein
LQINYAIRFLLFDGSTPCHCYIMLSTSCKCCCLAFHNEIFFALLTDIVFPCNEQGLHLLYKSPNNIVKVRGEEKNELDCGRKSAIEGSLGDTFGKLIGLRS